nr:hypothetical protein [uncultured Kingella sp.]
MKARWNSFQAAFGCAKGSLKTKMERQRLVAKVGLKNVFISKLPTLHCLH